MARFIVEGFGDVLVGSRPLDYESVLASELRQDEVLERTADGYGRVVIWMEYDASEIAAIEQAMQGNRLAEREGFEPSMGF